MVTVTSYIIVTIRRRVTWRLQFVCYTKWHKHSSEWSLTFSCHNSSQSRHTRRRFDLDEEKIWIQRKLLDFLRHCRRFCTRNRFSSHPTRKTDKVVVSLGFPNQTCIASVSSAVQFLFSLLAANIDCCILSRWL